MNECSHRGTGRTAVLVVILLAAAGGLTYWRIGPFSGQTSAMQSTAQAVTRQKDNSACLVCHLDLENEDLVAVHLKAGIVCAGCHGDSEMHRSDELNVAPPDIVFGANEIVSFCKACHPTHKYEQKYQDFMKEWDGRRRPNARLVNTDSLCTDCHGNHVILDPSQQTAG